MKKLLCFLCAIVLAFTFMGTASAVMIPADFVFIIDATGSMAGEIAGVRAGFSSFVNGVNAAGIDAQYAIILFGGSPELVLDFTSDATATQTALNNIVIGSSAGFQRNHNVNPEAGLEAIRIALGAANDNNDANYRTNVGGSGDLVFRDEARTNLIVATDEDSDRPFYIANRQPGQTNNEPPSNIAGTGWQTEVDNTAQAIIDNDAFLNILLNRGDTPSTQQYGDWTLDVSDPDFLNFNPAATLANYVGAGLDDSLVAQVLDAGLIGRAFNVAGANDPDFVDNFFAAKIEEIIQPVPEPTTMLLLATGLVGLAGFRRKFRN